MRVGIGHDLRQGHKFLVAANGFPKTAGRVKLLSCFNTFLMLAPDKQQSGYGYPTKPNCNVTT
jgi:hypothetical protein